MQKISIALSLFWLRLGYHIKIILVYGGGFDYSLVNFNWALMKQKFQCKVYLDVKINPKRITLVTFRKFHVKLYGKSNQNCANKTPFNLFFMLRAFNLNFMQRALKLLFDIRGLIQILTT